MGFSLVLGRSHENKAPPKKWAVFFWVMTPCSHTNSIHELRAHLQVGYFVVKVKR
jgi:hypothetical protein